MNQSLLLLLATIMTSPTTITTLAMQQGCRTTTSTQSITCTQNSCTPSYQGGCNDAEYQEDSTQTYCNVDGDTTTCGYSVVCCSPQSNNNGGGGMVAQSSPTAATCGNGNRGNAICPIQGECCSEFGWCGTTPDHCGGNSSNNGNNNYNANKNQAAASSDWWDSEAVYKKDPSTLSTSTTQYSNTYSSTWNGQQLPSAQQQLRSESAAAANNNNIRSYSTSPTARQAGAGAGLGFAFVVIVIAGCYAWRREQDRADCPGGTDAVVVSGAVLDRLDPDGGSLAMRYGIDDGDDEDSSDDDGDDDGRSRRSRKVGRDPSVYGQFSRGQSNGGGIDADVEDDGRSKKSISRRAMGRDPSVRLGGSSGSGSGSGGSRRRVVDDDARSHRSSTKSKRGGGGRRDPSINNGGSNGSGSNGSTKKKTTKKKPQYPAPAPPRPPPTSLHRKLSNNTRSTSDTDSRKQRQEWVKKTIYDTGSEDEEGLDDDTDSQLNWAA
eukprot:scaffold12957_cov148-Skeletonema_marinoi.AAC.3